MLQVVVACALIGQAAAQPPSSPLPPLSGPAIAARVERPTLVSYDMQNRLRDLEAIPEQAAFGLLKVDGETRERVEVVFAARAARIGAFVVEHLQEFGELDTASKAGAKLDATIMLARLI